MAMSLSQQLEEVEYEIMMRKAVYPRLVMRKTLRQAEADFHISRMEAVAKTMKWLIANESTIKQALKQEPADGEAHVQNGTGDGADNISRN